MLIEPNSGPDLSKADKRASLPPQTVRAHCWEGEELPRLTMQAQVDLRPVNQRLFRDVAKRTPAVVRTPVRLTTLVLVMIFTAVFSYFIVSRYVVAAVVIKGRSMSPTLKDGDRYMLNRLVFHFREPQCGDLVVIRDPGHNDFAVKRIVALPSDTVQIRDGSVYVNGMKLRESYLAPNTRTFPIDPTREKARVPENSYYVLGDNRTNSEDSRFYGAVHRDRIVGLIAR